MASIYVEHGLVQWDGLELLVIAPPRRWTGEEAEPEWATETVQVYQPTGEKSWDLQNGVQRTVDVQPADARMMWDSFGVEVQNGYVLFDTSASGEYVQVPLREIRG